MTYANEQSISRKELPDGINITEQEYVKARDSLKQGKQWRIIGDKLVIASDKTKTVYSTADGKATDIPDNFPVEDGFTETERPSQFHSWGDGAWGLDEQAERQSKIPTSVSRRQGRLALLQAGYLTQVEDTIDAITDPVQKKAAQIEYEADTWSADSQFLNDMWAQLGGTQTELEDLLISAKDL